MNLTTSRTMEFDLKIPKFKRSCFLLVFLLLLLLQIVACQSSRVDFVEEHGFSNLEINNDELWFGAGYKLYRVDLIQKTATLIYDTGDVRIIFVRIDGNRLFFGGSSEKRNVVWSLGFESEKILWTREFSRNRGWLVGSSGLSVSPLITSELLLVGEVDRLYALDKGNGDLRWEIDNNFFYELAPMLINDQLVYSIDKPGDKSPQANRILAIADPSSSKTIKTISRPGYLGGTPAVHGSYFFIKEDMAPDPKSISLSRAHRILLNCIDFPSGEVIWSVEVEDYLRDSQIEFYDGLVIDVFYNQVFAIDEQTGSVLWKSQELDKDYAAYKNPQVIEKQEWIALETTSNPNKIIFLELADGKLRSEELENLVSSPIFVGEEAIYGTEDALVRVDIVTGRVIWSIPVDSHYLVRQYNHD
jgi:outer membrane protein assembly factor BamB